MLGDGIVSFGVAVVTWRSRNENASAKIGDGSEILPSTRSAAEVNSRSPDAFRNWTVSCSSARWIPPRL